MFSFKRKSEKKVEKKLLGFEDIENELRTGHININTSIKLDKNKTLREVLLIKNFRISMLLNFFFNEKDKNYIDDYLSAIEQLNTSISSEHFEHIMQHSNKTTLKEIINKVENDFNDFCKNYVGVIKVKVKLLKQLESSLDNLYLKAEQILMEAEVELLKLMPSKELIDECNKVDVHYTFSSSTQYKKLETQLKDKPKQLAFISEIVFKTIK